MSEALCERFPLVNAAGQPTVDFAISRMRKPVAPGELPGVELAGSVLRRLDARACAGACALKELGVTEEPQASVVGDTACADFNVERILQAEGLSPEDVIVVSVAFTPEAERVAFVEDLEDSAFKPNWRGFRELASYNAVAGYADSGRAFAMRLADCVSIAFTGRTLADDREVMAMVHLGRPNMKGEGHFTHESDGQKVSASKFYVDEVVRHYGLDPSTLRARNVAAISKENFPFWFPNEATMDKLLPGWFELGFVRNKSYEQRNAGKHWERGVEFNPDDEWSVDYRAMADWQLSQAFEPHQIETEGRIDPGDITTGHATNAWGRKHRVGQEIVNKFTSNDGESMPASQLIEALGLTDSGDIATLNMYLHRFGMATEVTAEGIGKLEKYVQTIGVRDGRDLYLLIPNRASSTENESFQESENLGPRTVRADIGESFHDVRHGAPRLGAAVDSLVSGVASLPEVAQGRQDIGELLQDARQGAPRLRAALGALVTGVAALPDVRRARQDILEGVSKGAAFIQTLASKVQQRADKMRSANSSEA